MVTYMTESRKPSKHLEEQGMFSPEKCSHLVGRYNWPHFLKSLEWLKNIFYYGNLQIYKKKNRRIEETSMKPSLSHSIISTQSQFTSTPALTISIILKSVSDSISFHPRNQIIHPSVCILQRIRKKNLCAEPESLGRNGINFK